MTAKKKAPPDDYGDLTIGYLYVDELVSADRNAKGHDLDLVDASMDRYGYGEPILLDERTGKILSGHGRRDVLLQRQQDGKIAPRGVKVDDAGRFLVPVARGYSSANDDEALGAGITFNQATVAGGWNWQLLLPDLERLEALDQSLAGLDALGFTQSDIVDLRAMLGSLDDLETQQRAVGEPGERDFWPVIRLRVSPDTKKRWDSAIGELREREDDEDLVSAIIGFIYTATEHPEDPR